MSDRRSAALAGFENVLGHRFSDRELLREALRHASAANEQGAASNERLEFLGDAALNHAVALLLFRRWDGASEGELTRARAALVRESSLVEVGRRLGVDEVLELGVGVSPSPSLVADAVEAVLGAVLLDGGWRRFTTVTRRLLGESLRRLQPDSLPLAEPKPTLQELAQRRGLALPLYRELEVRGPAHSRTYVFEVELDGEVLGRGEGYSKRAAQQEAARRALEHLRDGLEAED